MEAEAVGYDTAGTSSSIAATVAGSGDSVMTSEPPRDMPAEMIVGTDSQPPRPKIQYSTDLRKELSLDVLASLGGSSAGDAKSPEDSIMDLASVRADMEFISEFSSLNLPLHHDDSAAPNTLPPSSANTSVDPSNGSGSTGDLPRSEVSLPRSPSGSRSLGSLSGFPLEAPSSNDPSLSLSGPMTIDLVPSLPVSESFPNAFRASLTSSAVSIVNSMPPVTTAHSNPVSSASTVVSSSHVASTVVSSTHESSRVSDATAELSSSRPSQEFPVLALAHRPISDCALAALEVSCNPVEPQSASPTRSPVMDGDGAPATVVASEEPSEHLSSSPVHAPVPPPPESLSYPLTSSPSFVSSSAAREPLPVVEELASFTSVDPIVADDSRNNAKLPSVEMQSSISGDNAVSEAAIVFEPLLPAPDNTLYLDAAPATFEGSRLASDSLPCAVIAADGSIAGGPSSTSPPMPHIHLPPVSVDVFKPNTSSSALYSPSVPIDLSPPVQNNAVLDASPTFLSNHLSQSRPSAAISPPVSDAAPASFAPSLAPPTVLPGNSVSSPHRPRFWDGPSSSLSSEIPLSVYFDGSRSPFRGRKSARKKKLTEADVELKDAKGKGLSDAEKLEEVAELESMLEAQKKMVQWQIDEIQRIAALQCQLTGNNPLSEEVAWEVLGVKGGGELCRQVLVRIGFHPLLIVFWQGKKIGDSLSPEVLRLLQEIFAIKDTLTKKEARDISFTSGASLMQVREFFAAQRSLVRKLVQQAHDEAGRLGIRNASEQSQQMAVLNTISEVEKDLGFDKLTGPESIEKLLEVMRAEKGFAGKVQLLQVILHTDSAALILRRFLEKGGLKILGGWVVEAAAEQQTSVICHLLKVLDHLPMSNAISHQMPPLVQNVNKLRFHQVTAVAGQARSLFTKWCKLFSPKTEVAKSASSPGSKFLPGAVLPSGGAKRNRDSPGAQPPPGSRRKKVRAEEVLQHEMKGSPTAAPGGSPSLNGMTQGASEYPSSAQISVSVPPAAKPRWSSTLQPSESAVAAVSVSRKRLASKSLGNQSKDRRKLLPVEDNHVGKSLGPKPVTSSKKSRPLSTDDIYKAKKLERLMQEPVGKAKRRLTQEHPESQNAVPHTGASKNNMSPVVPEQSGPVKKPSALTLKPGQRNQSGGAFTTATSKDHEEIVKRRQLPTLSVEHLESKTTITPTSSQELFQTTITPTSSQELSVPGMISGDMSHHLVHDGDAVMTASVDTDPFSSLLGSSREELLVPGSEVVDLTVSDAMMSEDGSNLSHVQQELSSVVSKDKDPVFVEDTKNPLLKSKAAGVEDVCMPSASSEASKARLEQLSGLSVLRGFPNLVKSDVDVTKNKDATKLGQEFEIGNDPNLLPRETTLSDFYAALRASMIRWRVPPEYQPDEKWNVAAGEDSKEREVQSGRVKREEEAYYPELSAIPDDPKDTWEEEPNYDDSLTLEIFIENGQQKSLSGASNLSDINKPLKNMVQYDIDVSLGSDVSSNTKQTTIDSPGQELRADLPSKVLDVNGLDSVLQQLSTGSGRGSHDPDLLALLLRNPELVSQLTSGQAFTPSGNSNPGVFMQPTDPLKQISSRDNNGAGLSIPAGDLGQERLIPSNNSKALGIPLQPGRSVSSVDQTPSETMRVQDPVTMMPHPGMGQQQAMGFVPQGGVDNRFLTPQMPPVVARSIQDTSGWEQRRVPPPPPPLPSMQITNQALQPPLPSQPNKQSNWPEAQGWSGGGRPPMNPPQTHPGQEQLHIRSQTIMTHNARLPNYGGMAAVPQVDGGPVTPLVPQPEVHHSQRSWTNGSRIAHAHDNTIMHTAQESGAGRNNNRWPRPPGRTDQHVRSGSREYSDFSNGRQVNVVDSRSVWVPNDRTRPVLPPFQGAYGLPQPPPYPPQLWQAQDSNSRLIQGGSVVPFTQGRELRPPQQQLWHSNTGPASRQMWRGPQ